MIAVRRACLAALLAACSGAPPAPETDAGAWSGDAGEPTVGLTLATGPRGAWTDFEDGDVLRLQRGCQGSQHVFVSARVEGAADGPVELGLVLRRTRDGEVVSLPFVLRLPFTERSAAGTRQETGLTPVVPIPAEALEEEIQIEGTVVDAAGQRGAAVRRGLVRWGADSC